MIPERVDRMTSFIVMDVLEKAQEMERAGIDVIHLEVGEPDFGVPECVSEAICRAGPRGSTPNRRGSSGSSSRARRSFATARRPMRDRGR